VPWNLLLFLDFFMTGKDANIAYNGGSIVDEDKDNENRKAEQKIGPRQTKCGCLHPVVPYGVFDTGYENEDKYHARQRIEKYIDHTLRLGRKFMIENIKTNVLVVSLGQRSAKIYNPDEAVNGELEEFWQRTVQYVAGKNLYRHCYEQQHEHKGG
jgi:hypothetical protein